MGRVELITRAHTPAPAPKEVKLLGAFGADGNDADKGDER